MSLLSSPRRRRRLAWVLGVAAVAGALVLVAVLVPSRSGSGRSVVPRAPAFGEVPARTGPLFESTAAEERAARRSEAAVRPLARRFVDDLALRRDLPGAHALLAPALRRRYALADWQGGRDVPLAETGAGGGVTIAFAGATTVGAVATLDGNRLFAVRFEKLHGAWRVDYVHAGHGSQYVGAANFAPGGFVPGSRHETMWTWLALVGGVLGLIAIAVSVERRLSR